VSLSGLLDVVLDDPALARALEAPSTPALDLTGPPGLQPFTVAALVRAGRTVLAVTATGREAEDLVSALGRFARRLTLVGRLVSRRRLFGLRFCVVGLALICGRFLGTRHQARCFPRPIGLHRSAMTM